MELLLDNVLALNKVIQIIFVILPIDDNANSGADMN